jgi:hypothetical protein
MNELPQPPVTASPEAVGIVREPLRPGHLVHRWRVAFGIAWFGVLLGFAAVAKTARTIGLSTWWLGASAEPRMVVVQVLPFIPGVLMVAGAARNIRYLPYAGVGAALVLAAIAAGDIGRFDRLCALQFMIAGAALAVSAASFAGMAQRERSVPTN